MKIVFAQGNPGTKYTHTRHNIGMLLLDAYAKQHDAVFKDQTKFHARIAETSVHGEKVLLVFPTTFYNETGLSARALCDFYKLDPSTDFLVVHDDLALPFGTIRTRAKGSDAGNNGIKSLNAHLSTDYHRIRVGINLERHPGVSDVDFVLGTFSKEEMATITDTLADRVSAMIDSFIQGDMALTSHTVSNE